MKCIKTEYKDVCGKIQSGDIIAFSASTPISKIINWLTCSNVSHIGIVLKSETSTDETLESDNTAVIVEATKSLSKTLLGLIGKTSTGVRQTEINTRIHQHNGSVWWLPLSSQDREKLDLQKLTGFLQNQEGERGKPYDLWQAMKSAVDSIPLLRRIPLLHKLVHNDENHEKFFCSELVAAALETGGVLPNINTSEATPADLCRLRIFERNHYCLQGQGEAITDYNSITPDELRKQLASSLTQPTTHAP